MNRLFVLFAFILTATFANAQATQTTAAPEERAHAQAIRWTKVLALSAEQTTQIEAICLEKINAIDAINADINKSQAQKDADIAAVKTVKEAEFMAVLTPEQQVKYTDTKKARADRKEINQGE